METYVVRVVDAAGDEILRGHVRRVSDGAEQTFHGTDQLERLLRPPAASDATSGESDR